MITKLTDQEKIMQYDQLWRTIEKDKETIRDQSSLITQLSDELAAMTKTMDKAGDMMEMAVAAQKETAAARDGWRKDCIRNQWQREEWKARATELEAALRGLLEAEEATVEDFRAKEIDGLEAAMKQARIALNVIGEKCDPAGTGYACDYARHKRDEPCSICPLKGRNLTPEESEFLGQNVKGVAAPACTLKNDPTASTESPRPACSPSSESPNNSAKI